MNDLKNVKQVLHRPMTLLVTLYCLILLLNHWVIMRKNIMYLPHRGVRTHPIRTLYVYATASLYARCVGGILWRIIVAVSVVEQRDAWRQILTESLAFNFSRFWIYNAGRFTFGLVLSLSGIARCTHRPLGVIIVGIYIHMFSDIYNLLLPDRYN